MQGEKAKTFLIQMDYFFVLCTCGKNTELLSSMRGFFSSQNNRCAVCGESAPNGRGIGTLIIAMRATKSESILCHLCNMMLGTARDNPTMFTSAAEYLIRTSTPKRS